MLRTLRNVRWLIGASLVLTLLLSAPVAYGGGRWSGIDPEMKVEQHTLNVWVEWPTENTCEIGDIDVIVTVPLDAKAELVAESEETFDCSDGTSVTLRTNTSIVYALVKYATVTTTLKSSSVFQVNVDVFKNGTQVADCTGFSNLVVECEPIDL